MTVTNSSGATFNSSINATTLVLTDTTGTIQVDGAVTVNTLTTNANGYNLSLLGSGNTFATATNFVNTGNLTLGDAGGDSFTFDAGMDTTAVGGTVTIGGDVATTNDAINLGDTTMTNGASVDAGTATLDIGALVTNGTNTLISNNIDLNGNVTSGSASELRLKQTTVQDLSVGAGGSNTITDIAFINTLSAGNTVHIGGDSTGSITTTDTTVVDPINTSADVYIYANGVLTLDAPVTAGSELGLIAVGPTGEITSTATGAAGTTSADTMVMLAQLGVTSSGGSALNVDTGKQFDLFLGADTFETTGLVAPGNITTGGPLSQAVATAFAALIDFSATQISVDISTPKEDTVSIGGDIDVSLFEEFELVSIEGTWTPWYMREEILDWGDAEWDAYIENMRQHLEREGRFDDFEREKELIRKFRASMANASESMIPTARLKLLRDNGMTLSQLTL